MSNNSSECRWEYSKTAFVIIKWIIFLISWFNFDLISLYMYLIFVCNYRRWMVFLSSLAKNDAAIRHLRDGSPISLQKYCDTIPPHPKFHTPWTRCSDRSQAEIVCVGCPRDGWIGREFLLLLLLLVLIVIVCFKVEHSSSSVCALTKQSQSKLWVRQRSKPPEDWAPLDFDDVLRRVLNYYLAMI